jgi:precorrin-4 methylase
MVTLYGWGVVMIGLGTAGFEGTRETIAIRPSLHSIQTIVDVLAPYYGPHCPIIAIFGEFSFASTHVKATLSTIISKLPANADGQAPILVIG